MRNLLEMFGLADVIESQPFYVKAVVYLLLGLVGLVAMFLVKIVFRLVVVIFKGMYSLILSLFSKKTSKPEAQNRKAA